MGAAAATFLRGRLIMHGAAPDLAVAVVESASRPEQRAVGTTLMQLPGTLAELAPEGPVMILLGLAPRAMAAAELKEAL
jgi:siroheme synthase